MRLRSKVMLFIISVAAVTTLYVLLSMRDQDYLIVFSGAGMKAPVTEIAENYERETGIKVLLFFDGSAILRNYIIRFRRGDVFLSGDEKNLNMVAKEGLVEQESFVAWHIVSILVSPQYKGNISGLDDLANEGVRLAISNPKMASLGRLVMERIIEKHPKGREILNNVVVYSSSTADTLKLYNQGNIDAIIEWDVMASTPEGKGLRVVDIEEEFQVRDPLKAGLLRTSGHPLKARAFYDYFTTRGLETFRKHGYKTQRGH